MKTTNKKSIDSLSTQNVEGKKVKGGVVATGTHDVSVNISEKLLGQGKVTGRLGSTKVAPFSGTKPISSNGNTNSNSN